MTNGLELRPRAAPAGAPDLDRRRIAAPREGSPISPLNLPAPPTRQASDHRGDPRGRAGATTARETRRPGAGGPRRGLDRALESPKGPHILKLIARSFGCLRSPGREAARADLTHRRTEHVFAFAWPQRGSCGLPGPSTGAESPRAKALAFAERWLRVAAPLRRRRIRQRIDTEVREHLLEGRMPDVVHPVSSRARPTERHLSIGFGYLLVRHFSTLPLHATRRRRPFTARVALRPAISGAGARSIGTAYRNLDAG